MTNPVPSAECGQVVLDGVTLAFREFGPPDGLPVLLLHALASSSETWDGFAAGLSSDGRRVLSLDLRGHGGSSWPGVYSLESMRDDVARFLDHRGIDQVDLIGHSMGGSVAYLLAQRQPYRLRRLVIEDTPPPPDGTSTTGTGPYEPAWPPEPAPPAEPTDAAGPVAEAAQPPPFDRRLIEPVTNRVHVPDPGWWARLRVISAPTLLVSGGSADDVPALALARVSEAIPDCRVVTIEDAAYPTHASRPREFWSAVRPFLS